MRSSFRQNLARGGNFLINRAAKFQEVIREWCLLDLSFQGQQFTWHRHIYTRLDILRSVLIELSMAVTGEAFVEHLCRLHFDHNPIFLRDYRSFRVRSCLDFS